MGKHVFLGFIIMPVLAILFFVNMAFKLMLEMPLGENKNNPRTVTKKVEKFYCWLGDDVCKGFREYFLLEKK